MKRALSLLAPLLFLPSLALADGVASPAKTIAAPDSSTAPVSMPSSTTTVTSTTTTPAPLVLPEVGQAAPAFSLPSQDGSPVKLEDYRGKWVVLYFYPKDFTGGCTLEAASFQRDLAKYKSKKAVVLGVSVDSVSSHQAFCAKESLQFKLLSDADHAVSEKYGSLANYKGSAYSTRTTFLIDPDGVVRKVYPKVEPANHSAEVLRDLASLKKAKKG